MNTRILLLAVSVAALSSCSSVYKSGQTPDDVYYSPARPQAEAYVVVPKNEDKYQTYEQYQDSYRDDRFLRMSIGYPSRLGYYNDFAFNDWRYNAYAYNWNSPWNNYWYWNNFYNPYNSYGFIGYANPKQIYTQPISRPVVFNPNSYLNNQGYNKPYNNPSSSNNYYVPSTNTNSSRYNNSNSFGNSVRKMFNNSSSNSNNNSNYTPSNNNSTPTRSYTPSSSGSSSPGSSGGGGVSRPGRGGR